MTRPPRLHVAEPPRLYGRPPAVVDASVLGAIAFGEPELEEALARLSRHALVAPDLLPYEIANIAVMKHRRGAPLAEALAGLQRLAALDIALEPADPQGCLELAARYQLTAYDAAYLWLAAALRVPLLSFDARLADAARRHLASLD